MDLATEETSGMGSKELNEAAIFNTARGIEAPDARAEYLKQACGNDEALLERVGALLRVHDQDESFLESPPSVLGATADVSIREGPGTVIGPYKLQEQIGEGGFGIVYLAEQQKPVRRRVALKIIKPGMDSKQVIARFQAERQALALMDHPNIARVLDAGATEADRPYFVMELIKGIPITEYCDRCNLTTCDRLKLFISVCGAIQHAHQKGIIHRDVKPSNVMMAMQNGEAAPKVIDFGVAKAINQHLTEHTLYTRFAQMLGTPMYMSPEQAEMSPLEVDTRTDIYSLGVLLYELLVGATPFDSQRPSEASYDELRRIIREEEPPPPSSRLSTLGDMASKIAEHRRTDPKRLSHLVRGDLDWIVMKALEKERTPRYETANGLARDIERFLNDEPVEARSPSAAYRFRKFARRNRAALTTAAAVLVTVILGLTVSAIMIVQEQVRTAAALTQAQANYQAAEEQRKSTEAQRKRAEANYERAREAVDKMTRLAEEVLADVPQMQPARRALFEEALRYYQGFLRGKGDDSTVRYEAGRAYRRVGDVRALLGQDKEAESAYREAIGLLDKLSADFPLVPDHAAELAKSHTNLGPVLSGRRDEAVAGYRKAIGLLEKLVAEHLVFVDDDVVSECAQVSQRVQIRYMFEPTAA